MEELFRRHPLPWTTFHCDAYGAEWEDIIDVNGQQVDILFLVDALNGNQPSISTVNEARAQVMGWRPLADDEVGNLPLRDTPKDE